MKIGISTFVMQGEQTGVSTYIRNLIRYLQEEDRSNTYELLMARDDADLIPITSPTFSKRLYSPSVSRPIRNIAWHNLGLRQRRYDVLHIPSYRRIPLLKRTPVVATVHDLTAFAVDGKYDPARMVFNRRIVPSMIRRADHIIAVSQSTKADLVRLIRYPEKNISVVYSGIDHSLFRPHAKDEARKRIELSYGLEKPYFAYVSRLEHPAKNHIGLIAAFERFKLENDSAHQLIFAGADWHGAEKIRRRAAESPVHDDIIFLGFVPLPLLPVLYGGCDLMIYPSLYEGFGFPIVEALACGAPVICSATSSMKEIAGNVVPTFDPENPDDLFLTIERAVSNGWSAEQRARGMELARTYDWRTTARHVKSIYESVA